MTCFFCQLQSFTTEQDVHCPQDVDKRIRADEALRQPYLPGPLSSTKGITKVIEFVQQNVCAMPSVSKSNRTVSKTVSITSKGLSNSNKKKIAKACLHLRMSRASMTEPVLDCQLAQRQSEAFEKRIVAVAGVFFMTCGSKDPEMVPDDFA